MSKYKQIKDKPVLLLPEDSISKENHDQMMQRGADYDADMDKLRQDITDRERVVEELKAYNSQLEQRANEHFDANKQLQKNLHEYQQATEDLKEYQQQLELYIIKQTSTNKQLQAQINKDNQVETELIARRNQLEEQIKRQAVNVDQLQQEIAARGQSERDVTKKILLDKIKMLQKRKDREATKELLSSLALLDEILSQEMHETITSSEKVIDDGDNAVSKKP